MLQVKTFLVSCQRLSDKLFGNNLKKETDLVTNSEDILRRIVNGKETFNLNNNPPITRGNFSPTKNDIDGLSVSRSEFSSPELIALTGTNSKGYYVSSLGVTNISNLGLSVMPDPIKTEPIGHALIPELKLSEYKRRKANPTQRQELIQLTTELAELASTNIVYDPNKKNNKLKTLFSALSIPLFK